jgi:dienelactone hydrolase
MMKQAGRWFWILAVAATVAAFAVKAFASATADAKMEQVLSDLRDGKFNAVIGLLDERAKASVSSERLEHAWTSITSKDGKLVNWEAIHSWSAKGNEARLFRLHFEHGQTMLAQIGVNGSTGTVNTLLFHPDTTTGPATSPPYADTKRFRSEEVQVGNAPFKLPGILTVPTTGKGPWPAVVLLSGSGPRDMNDSIGPNHPFKDIAEGLSTRGIVVLRYDKRTFVYGAKMDPKHMTVKDEYLDDAIAAINFLRSQSVVDKDRIFVAGHSLGATIAPEVALKARPVQGLILLAPTGRKIGRTIVQQMRFLEEGSHKQLDEMERKANELDNHLMPPTENFMGAPASYYYDLDARNEVAMARQLDVPILILHGGRDYQVLDEDIEHWQKGLKGVAHVRVETFPKLNHLFIAGTGKPNKEEYFVPGHVDEKVITAMTAFIENPAAN